MKYNVINTVMVLATSLIVSCSGFLDEQPYGALTNSTFFLNEDQAELAVNACYQPLIALNGFWATGTPIFGNMCGDDSIQNTSINVSWVRGDFNPGDNYMVNGCYKNAYAGIARCNSNIHNVEQMDGEFISDKSRNRFIAEMRFIRAFWYFRLVRLYGDVPAIIEQVDIANEEQTYPVRTSVDEIYKNIIIPDLNFAAENLPAEYMNNEDISRATKGAAHAFLSQVYLNLKDWDNVIKEGENVEALAEQGIYGLEENLNEILTEYNEFNKEIIFKVGFSSTSQQNWKTKYFGSQQGAVCRGGVYGIGIKPHTNLVEFFSLVDGTSIDEDPNGLYDPTNFWENRDPRFDVSFYSPLDVLENTAGEVVTYQMDWVSNTEGGIDFQKNTIWYGPNNSSSGLDNVIMRYAEVLLNLAEAHIMKGNLQQGENYINLVRKRARDYALANPDLYVPTGLSANNILPDVSISGIEEGMIKLRYERRVEFAGEDIRGWDIRRWGIERETWAAVQGIVYSERLKLFPIPQSEMDVNPNLVQNTGY